MDDRLCKLEENQNSTQKNKEMSVLQEFIALPLKTNEEIQNIEKDLENQDFFEEMVNIFFHEVQSIFPETALHKIAFLFDLFFNRNAFDYI